MVWDTSPALSIASVALRLAASTTPLATLYVSKLIIDLVVKAIRGQAVDRILVFKLLALELALAVASDGLGRLITLVDSLLGDRFTNHVSLRLMEHATTLDLTSFEDPVFYDKMERARRQTTARLGHAGQSWPAWLSNLLPCFPCCPPSSCLSLGCCCCWWPPSFPVFLGETRFASLNYSMLYRYTPERRELDYLRYLGASNESAKEVKIFGLGNYLTDRSRALFERFYAENQWSGDPVGPRREARLNLAPDARLLRCLRAIFWSGP